MKIKELSQIGTYVGDVCVEPVHGTNEFRLKIYNGENHPYSFLDAIYSGEDEVEFVCGKYYVVPHVEEGKKIMKINMDEIPHWSYFTSKGGCLCGHYDSCDYCENIDWCNYPKEPTNPQSWIDEDFVVAEIFGHWHMRKREEALKHGYKIYEIADLLKGKKYRV